MVSDDIVTRLRQKYAGQLPICTEAADEIERLREHMDVLVDHNVELMAEVKRLQEHVREISIQLDRAMSAQA